MSLQQHDYYQQNYLLLQCRYNQVKQDSPEPMGMGTSLYINSGFGVLVQIQCMGTYNGMYFYNNHIQYIMLLLYIYIYNSCVCMCISCNFMFTIYLAQHFHLSQTCIKLFFCLCLTRSTSVMVMNFFHSYRCISSHMILEAYPKKCLRQINGHTPCTAQKSKETPLPIPQSHPNQIQGWDGSEDGQWQIPLFHSFQEVEYDKH